MIDLILRYMDPISSLMSEVKVSLVSVAISSVHPVPCAMPESSRLSLP
jgi:methylglyoxal synthase